MTLQELLDHPKVKRVCVGSCVANKSWEKIKDGYVWAHAHAHPDDPFKGWICVRYPRHVLCTNSDNLSRTMMHEFCHLTGHRHHNDRWRNEMHKWGQPIPARYQKRSPK